MFHRNVYPDEETTVISPWLKTLHVAGVEHLNINNNPWKRLSGYLEILVRVCKPITMKGSTLIQVVIAVSPPRHWLNAK